MLTLIGQALFFFLPSYGGNAAPVLLDRFGVCEFLKKRIDGGVNFRGEPLFGKTKTWRGLIGGVLVGMIVVALQAVLYAWIPEIRFLYLFSYELPHVLILGFLLGLGEGLGDLVKSFFKRRLHIKSSGPFFPFDQLSFLGAIILASLYYLPSWQHLFVLILVSPLIPVVANVVAYKLGWKKVWY